MASTVQTVTLLGSKRTEALPWMEMPAIFVVLGTSRLTMAPSLRRSTLIPLRRRLKASSMLEASPISGALVGEADEVADEPTWFQATTVAETTVPFSRPPTVQLGAMLGLGRNSQVPRTAPRSLFTVATYRSIAPRRRRRSP